MDKTLADGIGRLTSMVETRFSWYVYKVDRVVIIASCVVAGRFNW